MKNLKFLALTMLLASSMAMYASSGAGQPKASGRMAANSDIARACYGKKDLTSTFGGEVTLASLRKFAKNELGKHLQSMSEKPTQQEVQKLRDVLDYAKQAIDKLYPVASYPLACPLTAEQLARI